MGIIFKRKGRMRNAFLLRLLVGLILPFSLMIGYIGIILFEEIRADKAAAYTTTAELLSSNLEEVLNKYAAVVEIATGNGNIVSMNPSGAENYLNSIISDSGEVWSHFLITDSNGIEIAHTDGAEHYGTSIADRDYFKKVWETEETVICEPSFSRSTGRSILAIGAPIYRAGSKKGVLVGFVRLEYFSKILDNIQVTENSYQFMLNSDGTLSSHPDKDIVLQQNWYKAASGDTVSQNVINNMGVTKKNVIAEMLAGKSGVLTGEDFVYAYHPIADTGMSLCIVAPFTEAYSIVIHSATIIFWAILMAVIIGSALSIILARSVTVPFQWIEEQLRHLAKGNTQITERRMSYKSTREMYGLKQSLNFLATTLEAMLSKMDDESGTLMETVKKISDLVDNSNKNVTETSQGMEELASSMEEISATIAEINNSAEETLHTVTDIAKEAGEGSDFAKESQQRATLSERTAFEGKESTNKMLDSIREMLTQSIENSRKAEKIADLTADILGIAGKTNLLALNASIEAARAGEAGKGFAVVADEIRALAENSKETANNIQQISQTVIGAVKKLAEDAERMMQFVDTTVLEDYDNFAEVTQQYRSDSTRMDGMLSDFSQKAETLEQILSKLQTGTEEISQAIETSTNEIVMITEATAVLVSNIAIISEEVDDNKRISIDLRAEVDKFRN